MLVSVIAASHQGTGLAMLEPERQGKAPIAVELFRVHPSIDGKMGWSRLQVLPDSQDFHTGFSDVPQGLLNLL